MCCILIVLTCLAVHRLHRCLTSCDMPYLPSALTSADLHEQDACGINDAIDELAELAGVDLDSSGSVVPDSEEEDPATRQELRRLLDNLHEPVMPGAQYTTLQVNTVLQQLGCWWHWLSLAVLVAAAAAVAAAAICA